jgi:uncharacterized membrane protein
MDHETESAPINEVLHCTLVCFVKRAYLCEVIMIVFLQNRKYLGRSVHSHHIAIHPEIRKGIPG